MNATSINRIKSTITNASHSAYDQDAYMVVGWDGEDWIYAHIEDEGRQAGMVFKTRVDAAGLVSYKTAEAFLLDVGMCEEVAY
jgi:hypothetical protein